MQRLRQSWLGYRIALFALILQFCLSFGHTHQDLTLHAHPSWPVVTCHSVQDHPCSLPAHDEEHNSCAVCIVLAMLQSTVESAPPAVAVTLEYIEHRFAVIAVLPRNARSAFMFQARAPPSAA